MRGSICTATGQKSGSTNARRQRAAPLSALLGACLAAALLGVSTSCAGRPRTASPVRTIGQEGPMRQARSGAPSWAMQQHSWGKLDAIEDWLRDTPDSDPYWRAEAKLQLAEGHLRFADRSQTPGTSDEIVAFRKASALGGFEEVLSNAGATRDQHSRARSGARAASQGTGAAGTNAAVPAAAKIQGLVKRSAWKAARPNPRNMTRSSGRWNWITVHHSVFSSRSNSAAASLDTVRRIQREHIDGQKYADIGYHYLIDRAGRVIEGRSLQWQGAHAGGSNNRGNVGICLLGNFDEEKPSQAAIGSLNKLVLELQDKLRIPRKNVRPHRAWKETDCPGQHLMPWFARR